MQATLPQAPRSPLACHACSEALACMHAVRPSPRSCTWGGAARGAAPRGRGQTGTWRHSGMCRSPPRNGTAPSAGGSRRGSSAHVEPSLQVEDACRSHCSSTAQVPVAAGCTARCRGSANGARSALRGSDWVAHSATLRASQTHHATSKGCTHEAHTQSDSGGSLPSTLTLYRALPGLAGLAPGGLRGSRPHGAGLPMGTAPAAALCWLSSALLSLKMAWRLQWGAAACRQDGCCSL
jgi:hypothetical protein